VDHVFAFPNIVRFSWGTIEPFLNKAAKVEWPHEQELEKVWRSPLNWSLPGA
jgi:hypothetical protein